MAAVPDVALVTGATGGIGRATALALGAAGAVVYGTATTASGAAQISADFAAAGLVGEGCVLDVTDADQVAACFRTLAETAPAPVSIVVNNAAITADALLPRMTEAQWSAVIDTDLSAVYRVSKAALRGMLKRRRGRIVNVASVVGLMGNAGQTNYAAAKAGVIGFTKALAREVASRAITVNAVAPGYIDTAMTAALSPAQQAAIVDSIPAGRLGRPEDVAQAVCFLASPAAAYITGHTLTVSGGLYV